MTRALTIVRSHHPHQLRGSRAALAYRGQSKHGFCPARSIELLEGDVSSGFDPNKTPFAETRDISVQGRFSRTGA